MQNFANAVFELQNERNDVTSGRVGQDAYVFMYPVEYLLKELFVIVMKTILLTGKWQYLLAL